MIVFFVLICYKRLCGTLSILMWLKGLYNMNCFIIKKLFNIKISEQKKKFVIFGNVKPIKALDLNS